MKQIRINNKIELMLYKTYGLVPNELVKNICKFIHNNYRRRKHKPYIKKGKYDTTNTKKR